MLCGRAPGRPQGLSALVVHLGCLVLGSAFKYKIQDTYYETGKWSFTETYMYGSHKVRQARPGSEGFVGEVARRVIGACVPNRAQNSVLVV